MTRRFPHRLGLLAVLLLGACKDSTAPEAKNETTFDIELRWVGTKPTGAVAAAFDAAATRIGQIILNDLQAAKVGSKDAPFDLTKCSASMTGVSSLDEIVDDLVIYAKVEAIDGVGKTLGSAGPCLTRVTGGLTVLGIMRFDSADLTDLANKGRLNAVVLHEMLHVVGVGTLWRRKGILADSGLATVRVTGPLAASACVNDHGGASVCPGGAVPAENCLNLDAALTCGVGTIDSHWKESVFQGELMTGYLQTNNPLSKMTLQSLADLGYIVSLSAAEPYTVPTPPVALTAGGSSAALRAPAEELTVLGPPLAPRFVVDELGRTSPIRFR
ncbi:MAG: hypothetical protein RL625_935 [Gemmatimonadota bacterium]